MLTRTVCTDWGEFTLTETDGALTKLMLPGQPALCGHDNTPLLIEAEAQLSSYLAGKMRRFTVPLAPKGTAFQQLVWQALMTVPYGQTRSYAEIAAQIGYNRAFRAVGMANHCNPLPIFIPCHRIVGKDGALTGYAGGIALKARLLALETEEHL